MALLKHQRVLLKVSGEALMGDKQAGHDYQIMQDLAEDIKQVRDLRVEICLVVGGGNIYRGSEAALLGIERTTADYIGMIATVVNALALQSIIEATGIETRVMSAIPIMNICEPYISRRAKKHIAKGRLVIFAAGTGAPFFTTDTAAVLRSIEMNCDLLLKGTKVDGVYDCDPVTNPQAVKYSTISYTDILSHDIKVMDMAAVALAREHHLPIKVFSIKEKGNLARILQGQGNYTKID